MAVKSFSDSHNGALDGSNYFSSIGAKADFLAEEEAHGASLGYYKRTPEQLIQEHILNAQWRLKEAGISYDEQDIKSAFWANKGGNAKNFSLVIDRLGNAHLLSQKNFDILIKGDADRLKEIATNLSNPKLKLIQEVFDKVITMADENSAFSCKSGDWS